MLLTVKRARLEAGLTVKEVGAKVGLAAQALSRVENGKEHPWPALRKRLADLYCIREDVLFADVDEARAFLKSLAGEKPPADIA